MSLHESEKTIRVLAVRQPWASLIVEGLKTIEVRSRATNIQETVAIYASTAKQETLEGALGKDYNYRILPTGKIIGIVKLVGSSKQPIPDESVFKFHKNRHLLDKEWFVQDRTFYWYLANPVKFSQPIPYKPPKGAVVWSKTELPEGIL